MADKNTNKPRMKYAVKPEVYEQAKEILDSQFSGQHFSVPEFAEAAGWNYSKAYGALYRLSPVLPRLAEWDRLEMYYLTPEEERDNARVVAFYEKFLPKKTGPSENDNEYGAVSLAQLERFLRQHQFGLGYHRSFAA